MLGLLQLLAIGLLLFTSAIVVYTARTLSRPPRRTYAWALARSRPGDPSELDEPAPFDDWQLRVRGLSLPAWTIAGQYDAGPDIVVAHGWGDSRVGAVARLPALCSAARRVFLVDLPAHGDAPGRCTLGSDELEVLESLIDVVASDRPVVLYGWSMGAGISIEAAVGRHSERVSAVVAEAPYRLADTPPRNLLRLSNLPYRVTLAPAMALIGFGTRVGARWRGFDRAPLAAGLRCPLLVLHGDRDALSPFDDGEAIASAAPRGVLVAVEGAGHNDLWTRPEFRDASTAAVTSFLGELQSSHAAEPVG